MPEPALRVRVVNIQLKPAKIIFIPTTTGETVNTRLLTTETCRTSTSCTLSK